MIYCHVVGRNGKPLYSTLPIIYLDYFTKCNISSVTFICDIDKLKKRHGKIEKDGRTVYLLTADKHIVDRPRFFREQMIVYHNLIPDLLKIRTEITKEINDNTKRFIHNITAINTYNLQNTYYLVPDDVLRKNIGDQVNTVKDIILKNPKRVAVTFLKAVQNNNLMKMQFSIFKKLYEDTPIVQISKHQLSKVIGNTLSIVYHLFRDKHIKVTVQNTDKEVAIDYDSFQTALFFILDNATKYCLSGSEFSIIFDEDTDKNLVIKFDMVSCKINDDEVESIYNEGFSGHFAKKLGKGGDGIGMGATVKALKLNNAEVRIIRNLNPSKSKSKNDILYENNVIEIIMLKQQLSLL